MTSKWIWPLITAVVIAGVYCTTVRPPGGRQAVSRHAIVYENAELDEVWEAAKAALSEIDFAIRMENKEKGLLDAIAVRGPHAYGDPPLMNILIREEGGQVRVDCMMAQAPSHVNSSRDYLVQFFTELDRQLN